MRWVSEMKKNTSKWWDAFLYVCHFSQCDLVLWVTAEESTDSVSRLTETCIRYTPASQMWHSMHLKSFLWKEKTTSMGSSQTSIHLLSFKWTDQPDGIKQSRDWGCSLTYRSFLTKTVSLEEFNWRCSENLPWLFHVLLSQLSPPHLLFLSPFLLPLIFFLFLAASSLLCLLHMCVAPFLILPPSPPISSRPLAPDSTSLSPPAEWICCQLICEQSVSSVHKRAHKAPLLLSRKFFGWGNYWRGDWSRAKM